MSPFSIQGGASRHFSTAVWPCLFALLLAGCGGGGSSSSGGAVAAAAPAAVEVIGACALPPGPPIQVGIEKDCSTSGDPRVQAISNDRILSTSELGLASGRYVLPDTANPTQLVVMFHGHQNDSCSWREHLRSAADRGAIAVAMDYSDQEDRQTQEFGFIENWGWAVRSGAADSVQAVQYFLAQNPSITEVFNFGTSMGGNVSGFAGYDPMARKADCTPIWDYWIATEGVHNLIEEYQGVRAVAGTPHPAAGDAGQATQEIEEENGGTIEQVPEAYNEITNTLHAADLAYLKGVVLTHGSNDSIVPVDQSRQMADALTAQQVPTHFYIVQGSDHVWEGDASQTVMSIGFAELFRLMAGGEVTTGTTSVADGSQ